MNIKELKIDFLLKISPSEKYLKIKEKACMPGGIQTCDMGIRNPIFYF